MTFNTGNTKGTDHCIIGNIGTPSDNSHLIGCIGEIIGFYTSLTDPFNDPTFSKLLE